MTSRCIKNSRQEDNKILITANILGPGVSLRARGSCVWRNAPQIALTPIDTCPCVCLGFRQVVKREGKRESRKYKFILPLSRAKPFTISRHLHRNAKFTRSHDLSRNKTIVLAFNITNCDFIAGTTSYRFLRNDQSIRHFPESRLSSLYKAFLASTIFANGG